MFVYIHWVGVQAGLSVEQVGKFRQSWEKWLFRKWKYQAGDESGDWEFSLGISFGRLIKTPHYVCGLLTWIKSFISFCLKMQRSLKWITTAHLVEMGGEIRMKFRKESIGPNWDQLTWNQGASCGMALCLLNPPHRRRIWKDLNLKIFFTFWTRGLSNFPHWVVVHFGTDNPGSSLNWKSVEYQSFAASTLDNRTTL